MLAQNKIDIFIDKNNYANILNNHGLKFKAVDYYLQVGEITEMQGWILHISVINMQFIELIELIIPILKHTQVPFRIPVSHDMCNSLLSGSCGYNNLAKVVCIYPKTDSEGLALALQLIQLTQVFKGPYIPTAFHLGGCMYTRYGGFRPIIKTGEDGGEHSYIYNQIGVLVEDTFPVPASIPIDINWPFDTIIPPKFNLPLKILNNRIKVLSVLKPDVKGNVIKGLYMKSWFQAKRCVVKEGKRCMFMDEYSRDIQDRLEWQLQLHQELAAILPIPKVLDYFTANGDVYLALEYINGVSIDNKIDVIYEGHIWPLLPVDKQLKLLDYLLAIIDILGKLHERGYVHRDISPYNFLVDKRNNVYIIDLELVYSVVQEKPKPVFAGGTDGFTAPEQSDQYIPDISEDIYGLGALMILFFTNLSPLKFDTEVKQILEKQLEFFIAEGLIVELITNCLQSDPIKRPNLSQIRTVVDQYSQGLKAFTHSRAHASKTYMDSDVLSATIHRALEGICCEKMTYDGLWFSRTQQQQQPVIANRQNSISIYPNLYEGVGGVLWTLAQFDASGIKMRSLVKTCYQHNWEYWQTVYQPNLQNQPAGLYNGSAGMAVILGAAYAIGEEEILLSAIQQCLKPATIGLDLMCGAAGQGIAIMECMPYLPADFAATKLQELGTQLIAQQQSDGAWISLTENNKRKVKITGLLTGAGGITCFLLRLSAACNLEPAKQAAAKALHWLQKQAYKRGNSYVWPIHTLNKQADPWVYCGGAGIALTFIKAYEQLQDPFYKKMAVGALNNYPFYINTRDMSQAWGLAGLGEVYLEAARIFGEDEWTLRAHWIANIILYQQKMMGNGAGYWLTDMLCSLPTADLMTGNSGIIHFLARCLLPDKLSYPLL
jgi:serine/threonine protein kinase